jgi:hypothetical protein
MMERTAITVVEGLQRFLKCVQMLTEERRLLCFLYIASKEH